ncbi:hypothetical protein GCM10028777_31230 [Angustibacter speluncae]
MRQQTASSRRRLRGEGGAATLEYVAVLVAVAVVVGVVGASVAATRPDVVQAVECTVRGFLEGDDGCDDGGGPTTYDATPAAPPPGQGDYGNAQGGRGEVDPRRVDDAVGSVRDSLDGGWDGTRQDDLRDIYDTLAGLNGPELDAAIAELSDDELRRLVEQMEEGWFGGGWSREDRRLFWNMLAEKGNRTTLDRLSRYTDELRPDFSQVGGDSAREDPESIANQSDWGELDHVLFEQDGSETAIHPNDVSQGALGDCWFIAPMMALAQQNPGLIERAIRPNPNGSFTVTLYQDGQPVQYVVTPDMVIGPDGSSAFVDDPRRGEQTELWPLVLEKAMAMHAGSYADIEGDWPDRALGALTGQETTNYDGGGDLPGIEALDRYVADGGVVAMSSLFDADGHDRYSQPPNDGGLVTGHAYYVQSVDPAAGTVTVVNPWGISDYPPITMSYEEFTRDFSRYHWNPGGS